MKNIIIVAVFILLLSIKSSFAQNTNNAVVGIDAGWNSKVGGFGLFADKAFTNNISGYTGCGLGFWGIGGGLGIHYFFSSYFDGLYLGSGVCLYSGYTYTNDDEYSNKVMFETKEIAERKVSYSGNIVAGYSFKFSGKYVLYTEFGYSVAPSNSYRMIDKDYESTVKNSSPGGIVVALGFGVIL